MSDSRQSSPSARPYPTLRFLAKLYTALGWMSLLSGGAFFVFMIIMSIVSSKGVTAGSQIGMSPMFLFYGGIALIVAESIQVVLDIEEHTRRAALINAKTTETDLAIFQIETSLLTTTELLAQLVSAQKQTNERLETLAADMNQVRNEVATGVQAMQSTAESSKVTATLLYRNGARPS